MVTYAPHFISDVYKRQIQYYAITGFVSGSPREVLREALKANLISDEAWMDILKVRNELTHDYDCCLLYTSRCV